MALEPQWRCMDTIQAIARQIVWYSEQLIRNVLILEVKQWSQWVVAALNGPKRKLDEKEEDWLRHSIEGLLWLRGNIGLPEKKFTEHSGRRGGASPATVRSTDWVSLK